MVIQLSRFEDGTRKILQISEIVGMEGDVITMQDIFVFERSGVGENAGHGVFAFDLGVLPLLVIAIAARHHALGRQGRRERVATLAQHVEVQLVIIKVAAVVAPLIVGDDARHDPPDLGNRSRGTVVPDEPKACRGSIRSR